MKDPRRPISPETARVLGYLLVGVMLGWVLYDIWFEPPTLVWKIVLTVAVVGGLLVVSWPIRKTR